MDLMNNLFMNFMNNILSILYKVLFMKSMNNLKKLAAGIPGLAAGIPGLAAEIPGKLFSVSEMFGISLPSRAFSSESLMVGENLVSTQVFDSVSDADMLAELRYLEDFMVIPKTKAFFLSGDIHLFNSGAPYHASICSLFKHCVNFN